MNRVVVAQPAGRRLRNARTCIYNASTISIAPSYTQLVTVVHQFPVPTHTRTPSIAPTNQPTNKRQFRSTSNGMPARKDAKKNGSRRFGSDVLAEVLALDLGILSLKAMRRYVRQRTLLVSSESEQSSSHFQFVPTARRRHEMIERVKKLRSIVLPEQRSPEWYAFRREHLTASDTGTILGMNKYSCPAEVIIKKTGVDTFTGNAACEHGIKYEPVTNEIYQARTGHTVHDFGCIPDDHDTFVAASPDGIRDDGVMVEYKNSYSRTISGIPKESYYAQVQQQLKVADLERADFVETKIREYVSVRAYEEDHAPGQEDAPWTKDGKEKGVGVASTRMNGRAEYQYAPLSIAPSAAGQWVSDRIAALGDLGDYESVFPFYWHCDTYSSVPIYRDRLWWADQFPILKAFWARLQSALLDPVALERANREYAAFKGTKGRGGYKQRRVAIAFSTTSNTTSGDGGAKNDDHLFSDSGSDSDAPQQPPNPRPLQGGAKKRSPKKRSPERSPERSPKNDDHLFSDSDSD